MGLLAMKIYAVTLQSKRFATLSPEDNAAAIARFRREAEVTGRLEHPGIVRSTILDVIQSLDVCSTS